MEGSSSSPTSASRRIPSESDADPPGVLLLVATPIGNLEDLSPRAARSLAEADVIACEDTRRTGRLLAHLGIHTPLTALHDHNERQRAGALLDRVAAGETVVLVSDAGTPGVSDPGYVLVAEAVGRDLPVSAIPGPSAVLHALVVSGMPTDRFAFEGFLPRKSGARRRRLEVLAQEERTLVFYVAPHRAEKDLVAMVEAFGGERPAVLARELTKMHEEVRRGTLADLAAGAAERQPRGEVTVVVAPAPTFEEAGAGAGGDAEPAVLRAAVDALVGDGLSRRDAVRQIADERGLGRRAVYEAATAPTVDPGD